MTPMEYYPPNLNCIWRITVPKGHFVNLTMQKFKLGWIDNWADDIAFFDGLSLSDDVITTYYSIDSLTAEVIHSRDPHTTVQFALMLNTMAGLKILTPRLLHNLWKTWRLWRVLVMEGTLGDNRKSCLEALFELWLVCNSLKSHDYKDPPLYIGKFPIVSLKNQMQQHIMWKIIFRFILEKFRVSSSNSPWFLVMLKSNCI